MVMDGKPPKFPISKCSELKRHLEIFHETIKKLKDMGATISEVSMDKDLLRTIPSSLS